MNENSFPSYAKQLFEVEKDLFKLWNKEDQDKLSGTKKKRRCTYNGVAECFLRNEPGYRSELYVYEMCLYTFADDGTIFRDREVVTHSIGFLTRKRMDPIECFPVYTENKRYAVKIRELVDSPIYVSSDMIESVRGFHTRLFTYVLKFTKKAYVYSSNVEDVPSFFVVPLFRKTRVVDIDWEFINKGFCYEVPEFVNYGDVVCPILEVESDTLYIVEQTEYGTNCFSKWRTHEYKTFVEYFKKEKNVDLVNPEEPLIRVKPFSFTPGSIIPSFVKTKPSICLPKETLLKSAIPYDLLNSLCALPAVCHRMYYLCLAFGFGRKIGINLDLQAPLNVTGSPTVSPNFLVQEDKLNIDQLAQNLNSLHINTSNKQSDVLNSDERLDGSCLKRQRVVRRTDFPTVSVLNRNNRTSPKPSEILQILSAPACRDVFNNERFEIFGDCFIKFAICVSLFIARPDYCDGKLSQLKDRCSSNKHLLYVGRNYGIASNIQMQKFSPSNWIPPSFSLPTFIRNLVVYGKCSLDFLKGCVISDDERQTGILSRETIARISKESVRYRDTYDINRDFVNPDQLAVNTCIIPDKIVADCVEALIGLYLTNCGTEIAYNLMLELRILSPDHFSYDQILNKEYILVRVLNESEHIYLKCQEVEQIVNHTFTNKNLLLVALTHPMINDSYNYQRFEFLGDALLDFLITSYIFEYCDNLTPGRITDLRSALVNNGNFARITVRLGLHKWLRIKNEETLFRDITNFVNFQEANKSANESYEVIDDWTVLQKAPKVLGDIFESLAAAIFLDSGKDLNYVWNLYYKLMKNEIERFSKNTPVDPMRQLHELCIDFDMSDVIPFSDGFVCTAYVTKVDGSIAKYHGVAANTQAAKKAAALAILRDTQRSIPQ